MLFNSYTFIFVFLPIVLLLYSLLGRIGWRRGVIGLLVIASFVYYGWWNPNYVILIVLSILFNYTAGIYLGKSGNRRRRLAVLWIGILCNGLTLGYFKYTNFLVDTINVLSGSNLRVAPIILPIALSFFTFQQIAYLVDAYRGEAREYSLIDYSLFVTFFPQLIAGPIVHHKEMLPQFEAQREYRLRWSNLAVGSAIFFIGLFKKVIVADTMAVNVGPIFTEALRGGDPTFFEAWLGAMSYTFQIYFDFSGYSDMAIGLARMFGILLPLNFHSPYKATNISDFWRRWHMTLSRFLRDYIYIPLGGNRRGKSRRYVNLMLTMLIGGLWHGSAWTFVFWGGLHGLYLCVHHGFRAFCKHRGGWLAKSTIWSRAAGLILTNVCVVVGWVFFRAESFDGAFRIVRSMFGMNGIGWEWSAKGDRLWAGLSIVGLILVVWYLPNTQQLMDRYKPALNYRETCGLDEPRMPFARWPRWNPGLGWSFILAGAAVISLLHLSKVMEFIYYQF